MPTDCTPLKIKGQRFSNVQAERWNENGNGSVKLPSDEGLHESERRLSALVTASSDAVYRMSADWSVMYQLKRNMQDRRFLAETEDANSNWLKDYIHPEDQPRVLAAIQEAIRTKGIFELEHRVKQDDGTLGWTHSRAVPLLDGAGQIKEWFGMASDVTAKKRATEALIQSEKLAAMGRLAASIAHEVNNPLESVTNLLYLARTSDDLQAIRDYLEHADRELGRAAAVTNQTLRFHKQSTRPTEITGKELLRSVLTIQHGRLLNSKVQVEERMRARTPVFCFEGEIRQVLNNLIGNAIDAMHPMGGRVLLRTRDGRNWQAGQPGLVLTVADTGPGMSPQTSQQAFEAFYTTKGLGGTGLGLWVTKEIVDRHDGQIRLRSSQQRGHTGTVFAVFLPYEAATR